MKAIAIGLSLLLVAAVPVASAGVTPNTAASMANQSGAKIAPAKTNQSGQGSSSSESQTDTAK